MVAKSKPNAVAFSRQSKKWTLHFLGNRKHMSHVDWKGDRSLSAAEFQSISKSIAIFQLGENAEGTAFKRAGRIYAQRTGDFEYLQALDLFIKEEQNHSAALARFMNHQQIPGIDKEWTDSTFRFIRRIAGLNVCVTVLITAEIVAAVYYRALGRATQSPVLRAICGQILNDEAHHLQFQASTLAKERLGWHPLKRWWFRQLQRLLMAGTLIVVWKEHRSVYRAGQFGFFQYAARTWSVLEDVLSAINAGMITNEAGKYALPTPEQTITTQVPGLPSRKDRFRKFESPLSDSSMQGIKEIAALLE